MANKRDSGYSLAKRGLEGSAGGFLIERVLAELNPPQSQLSTDSLAADPVAWIEKHFRIPETPDHLLRLGDYQKFVLRKALTLDAEGYYPYSVVVWSDIKKSIKSTVAAAVALWRAYTTPWASIKVIANDLKQADARVSYYIRRCIELHPVMKKEVKVRPSGYVIEFPNHARIEAIPVDPKGEAGGNDDLVIFSELWAANSAAASRMWTEMTLSPTKFGRSFRWVETYAGHYGESPLLEQLYKEGVEQGRRIEGTDTFSPPLELFENSPARMLCMWNGTPRMPWQTPAYYAQESAILVPSEFNRVHRNQWASAQDIFIPPEWWYGCQFQELPPMAINDPCILAVDASVDDDSFGILLLSGTPSVKQETPGLPGRETVPQLPPGFSFYSHVARNWDNVQSVENNVMERGMGSNIPEGSIVHRPGFSFVELPRQSPAPLERRQQQQRGESVLSSEVYQRILQGLEEGHYFVRFYQSILPSGGRHVSYADAERSIRWCIENFNVVEMCYDPYMLEDMAQRLRSEGAVHLHAFKQTTPRLIADKALYDTIRDRRVHATYEAETITEHLLNASSKIEGDGDKLRIIKRSRGAKIDLAVCLSMALARAVFWHI
jgi:hypothetical protein